MGKFDSLVDQHLRERAAVHSAFVPPATGLSVAQEEQIASASVGDLVRWMNDRTFTSEQVVKVFVKRSHSIGWALGGVTTENYEAALEEAKAVDAKRAAGEPLPALAGVPVSIKEHIAQKGFVATCGQAAKLQLGKGTEDAVLVEALRAAGAIPFVRSAVPQLLMLPEGYNLIYGAATNPYNPARSPGGSSSGEGTLVASRCSPCGLGTDIGGSVRIPAAMTGIFTIKPTPGRLAGKGIIVPFKDGFSGQITVPATAGPMGRCVDDLALMMRVFQSEAAWSRDCTVPRSPFDCGVYYQGLRYGENPSFGGALIPAGAASGTPSGSSSGAPANGAGALAGSGGAAGGAASSLAVAIPATRVGASVRRLRIGIFRNDRFFEPAAACSRAVSEAAEALRAAGHELVEWDPFEHGLDTYQSALSYYSAMAADGKFKMWYNALEGEKLIKAYEKLAGIAQIPNALRSIIAFFLRLGGKPRVADVFVAARAHSADELMAVNIKCAKDKAAFIKSMQGLDLILAPGLGLPAWPHGASADLNTACSYTFLWNWLCVPSGTVPVTFVREEEARYDPPRSQQDDFGIAAQQAMRDSAGLPVAVQLVGLPNTDELVLRGMKELEVALKAKEAAKGLSADSPACATMTLRDVAAGAWPATAGYAPEGVVQRSVAEAAPHRKTR